MKLAFPYICLIFLITTPALAQKTPVPVMSDEEVGGNMGIGGELETRLDGDLNGDGDIDTVFIERGEDTRSISVMLAYREETDIGHLAKGIVDLDPWPLGPAALEIKKGVLIVEDLTGGTTATAATYRYRYDPATDRVRLIGLDARTYSRTNNHGWASISWNLLTGDFVYETADLLENPKGDAAYAEPVVKKSKRPVTAVYMEETPSPEELISEQAPPVE